MNGLPETRFAILTYPRSGSTYLATLLNSHPQILCHGEIFYRANIFYAVGYRDGRLDLGTLEERDRDPDAFLGRIWSHPFGNRAVGFKLVAGQHPGAFRHVFTAPGVRSIVLQRRNRLKKFVSALVAEREQVWTHYKYRFRPEDLKTIQVEVSLEALEAYVAAERSFYDGVFASLEEARKPYVKVFYEDLFDGDQALRSLLDFLGVSPQTQGMEPATLKRNSRDLRDVITNFDELARTLRGSELERELFDAGN